MNKSRIVPKIYAAFYLKYISNPFGVDLVQGGFRKPRRVCIYASLCEKNSYRAEDLRRNFWLYISMSFSVDLVQGDFRKPRRVCIYASLGEGNSYGAEDLRCNFWFYISMPFSVKIWYKAGFPSHDAYVYTRVWVREIRMAPKIYAAIFGFIYQCRLA